MSAHHIAAEVTAVLLAIVAVAEITAIVSSKKSSSIISSFGTGFQDSIRAASGN